MNASRAAALEAFDSREASSPRAAETAPEMMIEGFEPLHLKADGAAVGPPATRALNRGAASLSAVSQVRLEEFGRPAADAIDPDPEPSDDGLRARDEAERRLELARVRGEARAEGFEAGVAQAEADSAAEIRMLASELRESLLDLRQVQEDQATAARDAISKVIEALLEGIAPACAQFGLPLEIASAVISTMTSEPPGSTKLQVRVAPSHAARLETVLSEAGASVLIQPDPSLGDLRAELDWDDGRDEIDLEAAIHAARTSLSRFAAPDIPLASIGKAAHG